MVSFLRGVPALAWAAHRLRSLRRGGSSMGSRPLRGSPLRQGVPLSVSPTTSPSPIFPCFLQKSPLLCSPQSLLSPARRCALPQARAPARAPRRAALLLSEPAGTGVVQLAPPPSRRHAAPLTEDALFIPNPTAELRQSRICSMVVVCDSGDVVPKMPKGVKIPNQKRRLQLHLSTYRLLFCFNPL